MNIPDRTWLLIKYTLIAIAGGVLLAALLYGAAMLAPVSRDMTPITPLLIALAFILALGHPAQVFMAIAPNLTRQLHGLTEEPEGVETQFIEHLFNGYPTRPPFPYTMRVEGGRMIPDTHVVLRKVGGPGFISIAHDSAVVTAQAGRMGRVLGPGFYKLKPFERVWDVVDLRPQKRTVRVEATTREGVPVYCDAQIRFHIDGGDQTPSVERPYPFLEDAVFRAATRQRRRAGKVIQRWESRVADGILDGEVRDRLERLWLDEIVLPDDQQKSSMLRALEASIEEAVREAARGLGVVVDSVQLSPIMPLEAEVFKQWLDSWRAIWQQETSRELAQGEAQALFTVERARLLAQTDFLVKMGEALKPYRDVEVPPELVTLKFLEVIRSLSESDPSVRSLMFNEVESLRRLVKSLQPELEDRTPPQSTAAALTQD